MLRLNLSTEPRWLDLGHGVRLLVEPLTTAIMLAARSDPTIVAAAVDADGSASNDDLARIVAKAVARIVVKNWEGVGDEDGKPLPLTPEGIDAASEAGMTCEVTPHHMYLSRNDLDDLGRRYRMNPPLRREKRRREVYDRVADGTVDMIATDHAPHTTAEKDASIWDAPSGVPGVETALPLLLAEAADPDTDLGYERVRDLTATNPATVFELPQKGAIEVGKDADLVLVDTTETTAVRADERHTDCGWTPFEGFDAVFPEWTMVRGTTVFERDADGDVFSEHRGENVRDADGELVE